LKKESAEHAVARKEAWRALETLYEKGKCKAIGVSNYTLKHLEQMASYWQTKPAVNQVECHPFLQQNELRAWCKLNGIFVEAYSSLGTGELLKNEVVTTIAAKYRRTPAQMLLRWGLEQSLAVIPKSINTERIKSNIEVFDFSLQSCDFEALNKLECNHHYCWDPTDVM